MSIRVGIVGVSGLWRRRGAAPRREPSRVRARLRRRREQRRQPARSTRFPGVPAKLARSRDRRSGTRPPCRSSTCSSRRCRRASRSEALARVPARTRRSSTSAATTASSKAGRTASPTSGPTEIERSDPHRQPRLLSRRVADRARAAAGGQADRARRASSIDAKTGVSGAGRGGGDQQVRLRRESTKTSCPTACSSTSHVPEMTSDDRR